MTCIVGIIDNGEIVMGGDSSIVRTGWEIRTINQPKIFRSGKLLIGCSGSLRFRQIIENVFPVLDMYLDPKGSLENHMIKNVVPVLKNGIKASGCMETTEDGTDSVNGTLLIGISGGQIGSCAKGQLIEIGTGFEVVAQAEYGAIGSGSTTALGSLFSTKHGLEDPVSRVLIALRAAAMYHCDVRAPFLIMNGEGTKEYLC